MSEDGLSAPAATNNTKLTTLTVLITCDNITKFGTTRIDMT